MTNDPASSQEAELPAIFDDLAREILHNYSRGRIEIAVDGPSRASTALFADSLGSRLRLSHGVEVTRVSLDEYDDEALRREVMIPFRSGGDGVPADAMLIVDGAFLLRPELRGLWNYTIWIESDVQLPESRLVEQGNYVRDGAPRTSASVVIDVSNPDQPTRVFGDSC